MNRLVSVLCVCLSLLVTSGVMAQESPGEANPRLGINLEGPTDWSHEVPFVDVFRLSRPWISQRQGAEFGRGPKLSLDDRGWVKSLEENCFAETPLCTIPGGHYPSGTYTVLYDGEGEIGFTNAGKVTPQGFGKLLVEIESWRGQFFLQIRKTNPDNYLRNIRVIMPGFEKTYQTEPFHPVFVARWKGVACFRFMDWMNTNSSKIVSWSDRPRMDDATWTAKGIPVEVMVDLCNRQTADAWFSMPHKCDDEYVRGFAAYVKQHLDPSLKVYIEYSNEMWNGIMESNKYAVEKARELKIGPQDNLWDGACLFYGQRSVEIFKIWEEVFGSNERLVRTLAWHAASGEHGLDKMLLSRVDRSHVDALAVAPYITLMPRPDAKDPLSSDIVGNWTLDQLMDRIEQNELPQCIGWMNKAGEIARKYNVKLIAYEAGQHLVGILGGENNDRLTELFKKANASERMGRIYSAYYKGWEGAGGDLLCHFASVGQWTKWGCWGLVPFYDHWGKDSPKYQATIDWANSRGQKMSANPLAK